MPAQSIQEVIDELGEIIATCQQEQNALGYFAALYRQTTIMVQKKLGTGYFEDDARMERLDVIFANRYLDAYHAFRQKQPTTTSWDRSFQAASQNDLLVLHHLLLGMNAHINLDLGIAAVETAGSQDLSSLQHDFNKINDILAGMLEEVEQDLARIWPRLTRILKWLNKNEDRLINFSMVMARDGAWRFANQLANDDASLRQQTIQKRDAAIADLASALLRRPLLKRIIFALIRWGEKGTTAEKIAVLAN